MIAGIFHKGSGVGNQLHRYVMTRCLSLDKGMEFGMVNPELFKGDGFMKLDMGKNVENIEHEYFEKKVLNEFLDDVRGYDFEGMNMIEDNTVIDGEFQGENYYKHHIDEIREWLSVDPLYLDIDTCVITFRGGEYVGVSSLFLPQSYWDNAIAMMRETNPDMKFMVVTDDVETAQNFFPDFDVSHEIGRDWRAIRCAHYLILSNSSFGILPTLLNQNVKKIIAPKFWARHNKGYWALEQNQYDNWEYII